MAREAKTSTPAGNATRRSGSGNVMRAILCLPPVLWLALVLAGYALVALRPIQDPDPYASPAQQARYRLAPVPGVAELERFVLPMLGVLVVSGVALRVLDHRGKTERS